VHSDEDDIMQLAIAMNLKGASGAISGPESNDDEMHDKPSSSAERFRQLRLALLKRIAEDLTELKKKGGVRIPQVLLILVSELRPSDPTERSELHQTLAKVFCELNEMPRSK
jgi:hypothetical protein